MIAIVDYGMGNPGSIKNMLGRIGADSFITQDPKSLRSAEKLILPGVGAFDHAVQRLQKLGFWDALQQEVRGEKKPFLGICLGMQLVTLGSEEGQCEGFGWIRAFTRKFVSGSNGDPLKVPHMGWNHVEVLKPDSILSGQPENSRFYFVHSYFVECDEEADVLGSTTYGRKFHSAVWKDNILGTQFHPEKSHRFGKMLLNKFAGIRS